jgi:hypothetical protein
MRIKETIFGWLRSTPAKSDELEDAEIDEATREYSAAKADDMAEHRFGTERGEFESDQQAPR